MPFDLAELFIVAAEIELGATLPSSYRHSMLQKNGGELETDNDDWEQYPIADTSDRKRISRTCNHILKETQNCLTWRTFPANAIAFATNGAGDQLVFLKKGQEIEQVIYAWSHETGQLTKVANDFAELKAL